MNTAALKQTLALGAMTGMRSMAGATTLALQRDGALPGVMAALAAGEMIADKTGLIGDRIDAIPLAGRAAMGAIVGGVLAHQRHANLLLGALVGASAAVVAAHLAYRLRTRLPVSSAVGGLVEDAIVVGIGTLYSSGSPRSR